MPLPSREKPSGSVAHRTPLRDARLAGREDGRGGGRKHGFPNHLLCAELCAQGRGQGAVHTPSGTHGSPTNSPAQAYIEHCFVAGSVHGETEAA